MKNKLLNGQHLSLNDQTELLSEFVMTVEGLPKVLDETVGKMTVGTELAKLTGLMNV